MLFYCYFDAFQMTLSAAVVLDWSVSELAVDRVD